MHCLDDPKSSPVRLIGPVPGRCAHARGLHPPPACRRRMLRSPCWSLSGNLTDIKSALVTYHDSGQYFADIQKVDTAAAEYLTSRAPTVAMPAIVFDIDETSLSNWPQLLANDFAYFPNAPCDKLPKGPCGSESWDELQTAAAIEPTLHLFSTAKLNHVAVFFITGRPNKERAWTEATLRKVGFDEWTQLVMRPDGTSTHSAADYKAPERKRIEGMGYTILVNVGDQPSDLVGGYAQKTFLLPNPF